MFERGWRIYLDEGAGGGAASAGNGDGGAGQGNGNTTQTEQPVTYETWLAGQNEDVRKMLEGHTGGLKTALQSERERNKTLEKGLRDAASKAEKGSEAERQLTEMANQVQESTRKNAFYENAVTAGVKNLKLAWMAAVSEDLFKKDGSVDFDQMKKAYPELFGGVQVSTNNAGSGGGKSPTNQSMDEFIRVKAGVASAK